MRNFLLPRHPGQRLKSFYSHTNTERGYTLWAEEEVHHTAEADIPEADPSAAAPEEDSAEAAEDREIRASEVPISAGPGSVAPGSAGPAGEVPSIPEEAGAVPADGAEDADAP